MSKYERNLINDIWGSHDGEYINCGVWDVTTCSLVDRHSFSLKREELGSSKMVVPTYHSTSCQIAVDSNLEAAWHWCGRSVCCCLNAYLEVLLLLNILALIWVHLQNKLRKDDTSTNSVSIIVMFCAIFVHANGGTCNVVMIEILGIAHHARWKT